MVDLHAAVKDVQEPPGPDADGDEARTLRPLQAAAVTYRIAFGPRTGHKVLTLRGAMPRESRQLLGHHLA